MFICNILLEVTYGSNKEDFYITILNSFSVKAYRFLPNMLSMPCFFLHTKPHMPLVHHKQQKQSIKHRHCGVTAALFLTSGKAPACLISMIYKEWTLQDLLLPRKHECSSPKATHKFVPKLHSENSHLILAGQM